MLSSLRAPPSQNTSISAMFSGRLMVTTTSLIRVRNSSLRSRSLVVLSAPPSRAAPPPSPRGLTLACKRSRLARYSSQLTYPGWCWGRQTDHFSTGTRTVFDAHLPVGVDAFLLARAAVCERAGIDRVGQQLVHRAIARAGPPHAPPGGRSPRQQLPVGDQLTHDLTRRACAPPQLEHAARSRDGPAHRRSASPDRPRRGQSRPTCSATPTADEWFATQGLVDSATDDAITRQTSARPASEPCAPPFRDGRDVTARRARPTGSAGPRREQLSHRECPKGDEGDPLVARPATHTDLHSRATEGRSERGRRARAGLKSKERCGHRHAPAAAQQRHSGWLVPSRSSQEAGLLPV
jgi:hypothetical protein